MRKFGTLVSITLISWVLVKHVVDGRKQAHDIQTKHPSVTGLLRECLGSANCSGCNSILSDVASSKVRDGMMAMCGTASTSEITDLAVVSISDSTTVAAKQSKFLVFTSFIGNTTASAPTVDLQGQENLSKDPEAAPEPTEQLASPVPAERAMAETTAVLLVTVDAADRVTDIQFFDPIETQRQLSLPTEDVVKNATDDSSPSSHPNSAVTTTKDPQMMDEVMTNLSSFWTMLSKGFCDVINDVVTPESQPTFIQKCREAQDERAFQNKELKLTKVYAEKRPDDKKTTDTDTTITSHDKSAASAITEPPAPNTNSARDKAEVLVLAILNLDHKDKSTDTQESYAISKFNPSDRKLAALSIYPSEKSRGLIDAASSLNLSAAVSPGRSAPLGFDSPTKSSLIYPWMAALCAVPIGWLVYSKTFGQLSSRNGGGSYIGIEGPDDGLYESGAYMLEVNGPPARFDEEIAVQRRSIDGAFPVESRSLRM